MDGTAAVAGSDRVSAMPAKPTPRWPVPLSAAASLLLHALFLLMLWTTAAELRLGKPRPAHWNNRQGFVLVLPAPAPPQAQQRPAPPLPDAQQAPPPKPASQPAPARQAAHAAPRSQPQAAAPAQLPPDQQQQPDDDVLGSIHDNWLPVPGTFRCHVRIDYQAGGTVKKVDFGAGCGNAVVVDSISRAIWKTQPLPLGKDQDKAGSLEFDFTP